MILVIVLPNAAAIIMINKQINVMNAPTGILTKSLLVNIILHDKGFVNPYFNSISTVSKNPIVKLYEFKSAGTSNTKIFVVDI